MIIKKINITAFGGIKDKSFDISHGINVIYGENESGKSTICAFLEAMLYGMNKPTKNESRTDIRSRFLPWDTQSASGSLEFSVNEKEYVLERKFGKTKRSDKTVLRYADSWEECTDFDTENIGLELLGLNEESFVKSVFMGQLATKISGKDDEILKKLSNISSTGDEEASFTKINSILSAAKLSIIPKATAKSIMGDLKAKKELLSDEESRIIEANENLKDFTLEINSLSAKINELDEEIKNLSKEKEAAREYEKFVSDEKIKENIKKLLLRKSECEEKVKELEEKLLKLKGELSAENVSALEDAVLKTDLLEKELGEIKLNLLKLSQEKEKAASLRDSLKNAEAKSKNTFGIIMLSFGVFFALIAAASFFLLNRFINARITMAAAAVFFAVAFVLCIFSALSFSGAKKHKKEAEEIRKKAEELENVILSLVQNADENVIKQKTEEILSAFNANSAAEIKERIENYNKIKSEEVFLKKELEISENSLIQAENDIKAAENMLDGAKECEKTRPFDEVDREWTLKNSLLSDLQKRKKELEVKTGHISEGLRTLDVVRSELMSIEPEIEYYKSVHSSLEIALSVMAECEEELKSGFSPELNKKVNEILSCLTDEKYSEIKLNDEYAAYVKEPLNAEIVDAAALSGGTYDLVYFAVRLGILKAVFGEDIPLIILDDTFLQLDDERQQRAIGYLTQKCKNSQVCYFTCHKDVVNKFLSEKNVNIFEL